MWCTLESGPRDLCSSCRVGGWGPLSFTFGRGGRRLSLLLARRFLFLILTKSNNIFKEVETFLMADIFGGFSCICSVGYLELRGVPLIVRGTSICVGYLCLYMGYLYLYMGYLYLCGVPLIIRDTSNHAGHLRLCGVPQIVLESFN